MTKVRKTKNVLAAPATMRAVVKEVRDGRANILGEEGTKAWQDIPRGVKIAPNDVVLLEKKGGWVLQSDPLPYREIERVTHPVHPGLTGRPVFNGRREDAFYLQGRTYYLNDEAARRYVAAWTFQDAAAEATYIAALVQGAQATPGAALSPGARMALASAGVEIGTLDTLHAAVTDLENHEKTLREAREELEQRPASLGKDIERLEKRLRKLKIEENQGAVTVSDLTRDRNSLQGEVDGLKALKVTRTTELEILDSQLQQARERLREREQTKQDPRAKLRELPPITDEQQTLSKAYDLLAPRLATAHPLVQLHIALKHAPFTVLTGPSGAGKTSLVHHYARALGMNVTTVAVQPNWTSVQDLHGYVDPVHRTSYRGTPFSNALETQVNYAAHNDGEAPLDLVLLDEINLSFVEYFLADYLSAFETKERAVQVATRDETEGLSGETYSWLHGAGGLVQVPRSFLIAGTANEDHTTRAFSDKFRDRSAFLLIPPPNITRALQEEVELPLQEFHVPRVAWEAWQDAVTPTASQRQVVVELAKQVTKLGLPFSARVFQRALNQYADAERLSQWFGLEQPEEQALDLAVSLSVAPKYAQLLLGRAQEDQRRQLRQVLLGDRTAPLTAQVLEGLWPKPSN